MTDQVSTDTPVVPVDFTETLKALAKQSKSADEQNKAVAERATAHAPYALSAIFGYGEDDYRLSIDGWIAAACDACGDAGIRSAKGKRNAAALREHGYTGLYNLAVSLKWLDDNMAEHGEALRSLFIEPFLRHDPNLDAARLFLFRSRDLTALEAETADIETIRVMYDAAEGDKEKHETAYWKDAGRPETFAALIRECKAHIAKMNAAGKDKAAEKLAAFAKFIGDMELAEIAAHETGIADALVAIDKAKARLVAYLASQNAGNANATPTANAA